MASSNGTRCFTYCVNIKKQKIIVLLSCVIILLMIVFFAWGISFSNGLTETKTLTPFKTIVNTAFTLGKESDTPSYPHVLRSFTSLDELEAFLSNLPDDEVKASGGKSWAYYWGKYGRDNEYKMGNLTVLVLVLNPWGEDIYIQTVLPCAYVHNDIYWINKDREVFPRAEIDQSIRTGGKGRGIDVLILEEPIYNWEDVNH